MTILVTDVTKRFGAFVALDHVSVEVPEGGLLALLGPSGSGKTTLLRVIAGLEEPDTGSVFCDGEEVTRRPPRDRNFGFVFQHYALFRHMSVFDNVAFALRVRGWRRDRVRQRVRELLALVRLEEFENRRPAELSGGQRQRVALARALAAQPRVLLLDEPFGALDARVRQELRQWLRGLHRQVPCTTVLVTHDQEEAFEVADRVVVMNHGRVEQVGSPHEVFERPASPFVMGFLGNVNVFHGRVQDGRAYLGPLEFPYPDYPHAAPREATGYVRPHELDLLEATPVHGDDGGELVYVRPHEPGASPVNGVAGGYPCAAGAWAPATVVHVYPAGAVARVRLAAGDGTPLSAEVSPERCRELGLRPGSTVFVAPRNARVFVPQAGHYII
jgi:sulfate transport system ATP-binding protein